MSPKPPHQHFHPAKYRNYLSSKSRMLPSWDILFHTDFINESLCTKWSSFHTRTIINIECCRSGFSICQSLCHQYRMLPNWVLDTSVIMSVSNATETGSLYISLNVINIDCYRSGFSIYQSLCHQYRMLQRWVLFVSVFMSSISYATEVGSLYISHYVINMEC